MTFYNIILCEIERFLKKKKTKINDFKRKRIDTHAGRPRRDVSGRVDPLLRRFRSGRRARVRDRRFVRPRGPTGLQVSRFWQVRMDTRYTSYEF